jgi:IclR family transcriptional regulator, KDG regulon repressor
VAALCNETAQIGVLERREVYYVARADSPRGLRLASAVGARLPAHCTALGKMLLAMLPLDELDALLAAQPLEKLTDRSITDSALLRRHLEEARAQRFAWEECESNANIACVAAPVFDKRNQPVAALSISTPLARMNAQRRYQLRMIVTEHARKLSTQLGAAD